MLRLNLQRITEMKTALTWPSHSAGSSRQWCIIWKALHSLTPVAQTGPCSNARCVCVCGPTAVS